VSAISNPLSIESELLGHSPLPCTTTTLHAAQFVLSVFCVVEASIMKGTNQLFLVLLGGDGADGDVVSAEHSCCKTKITMRYLKPTGDLEAKLDKDQEERRDKIEKEIRNYVKKWAASKLRKVKQLEKDAKSKSKSKKNTTTSIAGKRRALKKQELSEEDSCSSSASSECEDDVAKKKGASKASKVSKKSKDTSKKVPMPAVPANLKLDAFMPETLPEDPVSSM
jgi:hypothetical protein